MIIYCRCDYSYPSEKESEACVSCYSDYFYSLKPWALVWIFHFCFNFCPAQGWIWEITPLPARQSSTRNFKRLSSSTNSLTKCVHIQTHTPPSYCCHSNILKKITILGIPTCWTKLKSQSQNHYTNCSLKTKMSFMPSRIQKLKVKNFGLAL